MSDGELEPKKRSKRGRPSKNPTKKPKLRSDSISSEGNAESDPKTEKTKYNSRMLENYEELRRVFLQDGMSQQSQHLIRKIASGPEVPESARQQSLLKFLNTITQELLMNELEIVVLSIYLEKFIWKQDTGQLFMLLMHAAYAVKYYLCEDLNAVNAFLASRHQGFLDEFFVWYDRYKGFAGVNPKDLNDKYRELSRAVSMPGESKIMDYNFYVDEILQSTTGIVQEKKPIDELVKDQEIMTLYSAYKKNFKICVSDFGDDPLPIFEKLDSVLSDTHEPTIHVDKDVTAPSSVLKKINNLCEAHFLQSAEVKDEDEENEEDDEINH